MNIPERIINERNLNLPFLLRIVTFQKEVVCDGCGYERVKRRTYESGKEEFYCPSCKLTGNDMLREKMN